MQGSIKKIAVPVDGSANAMDALRYLQMIYGGRNDVALTILHLLPVLPELLTALQRPDERLRTALDHMNAHNREAGQDVIDTACRQLQDMGFERGRITAEFREVRTNPAKDICEWANIQRADALCLTRHGRSNLRHFHMGGVTRMVVAYLTVCPVWIVGEKVKSNKVLVAMDEAGNALKAAEHAGRMLAGSAAQVTLFHSIRHLHHYIPLTGLAAEKVLHHRWKQEITERIQQMMIKARTILLEAGLSANQIEIRVQDGGRSAAKDICSLCEAEQIGTVVVGRRDLTLHGGPSYGSVTAKLLSNIGPATLWIV
jgi:nucleotide-binding universal stress UspA family protein